MARTIVKAAALGQTDVRMGIMSKVASSMRDVRGKEFTRLFLLMQMVS